VAVFFLDLVLAKHKGSNEFVNKRKHVRKQRAKNTQLGKKIPLRLPVLNRMLTFGLINLFNYEFKKLNNQRKMKLIKKAKF